MAPLRLPLAVSALLLALDVGRPFPNERRLAAAESGAMDEQTAKFLLHRFGWYGGPPRTLAELSEQFNFTLVRTAIFEQRALYAAMKHGEPGPTRLQAVR
jgi:hypothetical protein